MKHPFALATLAFEDIEQVNGANNLAESDTQFAVEPGPFETRPPKATTMAIGEEGGGFLDLETF